MDDKRFIVWQGLKRTRGRMAAEHVIGWAGGFEPPHGRIKIPCLTTWRRPNNMEGSRTDLHGSPAEARFHLLFALLGYERPKQNGLNESGLW
jgi:hypothetical protein